MSLSLTCFLIVIALAVVYVYLNYIRKADKPTYSTQQQKEIRSFTQLLNNQGKIVTEGWARRPYFNYYRKMIKGNPLFIKEWDYYLTFSQKQGIAIAVTISDLTYGGLMAIAFIDLKTGEVFQTDTIKLLTLGKLGLSRTSIEDNVVAFEDKKIKIRFEKKGTQRFIHMKAPELKIRNETGFEANLSLVQDEDLESMNIATSWLNNRTYFYLNEKVVGMETKGEFIFGNNKNEIEDDALTILDWGRGKWTYSNNWYWSAAEGYVDGVRFGFTFGYGFSDRSPATENVLIYGNKVHKIDIVNFNIPLKEDRKTRDYIKPWKFTSNDNSIDFDFVPIVDRSSLINLLIIYSNQHQVFGKFSGKARLNDGKEIIIKDFYGFAEDVFNCY